jgi:pimeloyl-ACP methyl ester carboxylesterase
MKIFSKWTEVQGLRIHYLSAGDKESTVLLLHGGGTDSASLSWKLAIEPLAENHHVLAPDWPGYGQSDRPNIDYTNEYYVNLLGDFVQARGIEQASLVGISMGGSIALGFALQSPQRLDRLVLVDSYGLQAAAPAHKLSYLFTRMPFVNEMTWSLLKHSRAMTRISLQNIFYSSEAISEELVTEVHEEVKNPGAGRAFMSWQKSEVVWAGLRTVYTARLQEIEAPTLIVHGAEDGLVPVDCAHQAHTLIKNSQLHIIAGCGHWPQREKPDEFNRVVSSFLETEEANRILRDSKQ